MNLAGQNVPLGTLIALNAQPVGKAEASNPNPPTDATGSVYFVDATNNAGTTVPIDLSGSAVLQTKAMNAGAHSFSAQYYGDPSYNGSSSSSSIQFSVAQAPTSVVLTSNVDSISSGTFILDAQIMSNLPPNLFSSDGTITFTDTTNGVVLGTSTSDGEFCASGQTSCVSGAIDPYASQLAMGANSIVASFGGNSNFLASPSSAPVTVTCTAGCSNGTGQTIQLSFRQLSSATISAGGTITATVGIVPGGGFTGPVNMTCSIAGKNSSDVKIPTCSFDPAQVSITAANGGASTELTINTTAPTTSSSAVPRNNIPLYGTGGAVLAVVLLFGIPRRRPKWYTLAGVFLLMVACTGTFGCSGGSGGSSGSSGSTGTGGGTSTNIPGTTPDTYTVTFHAADAATGTVTAQDYFTFKVQ